MGKYAFSSHFWTVYSLTFKLKVGQGHQTGTKGREMRTGQGVIKKRRALGGGGGGTSEKERCD